MMLSKIDRLCDAWKGGPDLQDWCSFQALWASGAE
jgi:hypothetical protein